MNKILQFIHVPKVAGNSIKCFFVSLSKVQGVDCERTIQPNHNVLLPNGQSFICHGHNLTKSEICVPDAFRFMFVRNPYERMVSCYEYLKKGGNGSTGDLKILPFFKGLSFGDFVKLVAEHRLYCHHVRPQHDFEDVCGIDFVGKYENLNQDFERLLNAIGLSNFSKKLDVINSTPHKNYIEYYDGPVKNIVMNLYKKDFTRYGYAF